jgi:CTP:phosphocholine cytidylyltransferase-like protein
MTFTLLYNPKYFFDFKNHKENLASENIYEIDNLDELKTLLTQKSFDKIIFFNNPESNEIDKYLQQNYIEQKLSTHRRIWQKIFVPKP